MHDRRELGRFLRSRRERLGPEQVGLPAGARRRLAGLRREEVALLAGISVEYYVRLEQGRSGQPSEEVLEALARALALDADERRHLHDLARRRPAPGRPRPDQGARPELVALLGQFGPVPALLIDHRLDVLAWNRLAAALFVAADAVPRGRNLARFGFLDPGSRERFVDWADVARATVGQLRLAAARYPGDPRLAALIGELSIGSEAFRTLWAGRDVRERTHGVKRFRHPVAGELSLRFENFDLPGVGQRLVTFSAEPGSRDHEALALLASWTAPRVPERPGV